MCVPTVETLHTFFTLLNSYGSRAHCERTRKLQRLFFDNSHIVLLSMDSILFTDGIAFGAEYQR